MFVSQFATLLLLADSDGINPLDWWKSDLALWTAVVFLILLAVLWKFAWKPLAKGLDRARKTDCRSDRRGRAEPTRQARQLLADYQQNWPIRSRRSAAFCDTGPPRGGKARPGTARPGQERDPGRAQRSLQQIEAATAGGLGRIGRAGPPWPSIWPERSSQPLNAANHAQLIQQAVAEFTAGKK